MCRGVSSAAQKKVVAEEPRRGARVAGQWLEVEKGVGVVVVEELRVGLWALRQWVVGRLVLVQDMLMALGQVVVAGRQGQ